MIKELRLINWKSFGDTTLYIDPLTFVIGTNASGKSNILDALSFLHYVSLGTPIENVLKEHIRGGAEWAIRKGQQEFSLIVVDELNGVDYEYEIKCGATNQKTIELVYEKLELKNKKAANKLLFCTDGQSDDLSSIIVTRFYAARKGRQKRLDLARRCTVLSQYEVLPIIKEVKEACRAIASDLKNIFVFNPIPNHMRNYCQLSDTLNEDGGNVAGVLAGMDPERKNDVEQKLSDYVRPLPEKDINKVWAETVGRFGNDAMLYCEECWSNGNKEIIDARSMSDGTLRFVAIVASLLTGKPDSLLVIEEIDNGLHPSRAGELVKALRELGSSKGIDVICTTHNPALIDSLGVEMLPFISYVSRTPSDGTSTIEPVEDINNVTKLMANYTIGELMTKDKL